MIGDRGLFRKQRQDLIVDFSQKLYLLRLDTTIVFDAAYRKEGGSRSHYNNLEVIYTDYGETADQYILSEISQAKHPKDEVVITSDKQLASQVRQLQAKTETIEEFHQKINTSLQHKISKDKVTTEKKQLPTRDTHTHQHTPVLGKSQEGCFELYLEIFEDRFRKLEEENPWNPPISEFQRWLNLFEERLKESK